MTRSDLKPLIIEALNFHDGSASVTAITKFIWDNYRKEIEQDNRSIYTWQYDIRWAGQSLKHDKVIILSKPRKGYWSLL